MEETPSDLVLNDQDDSFGMTIFERTKEDNETGTSVEDRTFLEIMNKDMHKDKNDHWIAPLPFRSPRPVLQNNRAHALFRARNLDRTLQRDVLKKYQFTEFMQGILEQGHAELAPPVTEHEECWYLPVFGVYHPRKKDKVRIVFDSSSKYKGISLNDVLLTGPDLTNNLLGVLLRFRKEPIAITADIQQMFYCFRVTETHRNFLRFIWYKDNDPNQELIDYRMTVHVFGNSPSPAVATFGLRRTAEISETEFGKDVKDYVVRNFYVDDGLNSLPNSSQAIDLMRRTQEALKTNGDLRLHKIASNDVTVMSAFSNDDLAKDLKDIKLEPENLPVQRSLGLCWNLASDTFTFDVSTDEKTLHETRNIICCEQLV
ncbi:Hypothetical predicted protein [Mytilus galloprovincialis]|uniref:Reverse transcriptase domain-containing protein n=1 Tax=Mytilus galloprovincialis TaxID=29158 RepID=A0A8B6EU35_MYTGA|nr:Hypothetical predicted protein [Mytilus galloprovincialis]